MDKDQVRIVVALIIDFLHQEKLIAGTKVEKAVEEATEHLWINYFGGLSE